MSNNKELTQIERAGLIKAGLPVDTPSQLSDAFRLGMAHLQKENDELRTSLNSIQEAYLDVEIKTEVLSVEQDDDSRAELAKSRYILGRAIGKSPVQSLADVKAEAVMEAASKLFSYGCDADSREALANYANQLKEG